MPYLSPLLNHFTALIAPETSRKQIYSIRTQHLPDGVYFYSLEEEGQVIQSGKLMKVEG